MPDRNAQFVVTYFNGFAPLNGFTPKYAAARMYQLCGWYASVEGDSYLLEAPNGVRYEMRIPQGHDTVALSDVRRCA